MQNLRNYSLSVINLFYIRIRDTDPGSSRLSGHSRKGDLKNMRRKHVFGLLDCGQCKGILCRWRMSIDSPGNDWL